MGWHHTRTLWVLAALFCLDYTLKHAATTQGLKNRARQRDSSIFTLPKPQSRRPPSPYLLGGNPVTHGGTGNFRAPVSCGNPRRKHKLYSFPHFYFCRKPKLFNIFIRSLEWASNKMLWSNNGIIIFSSCSSVKEIIQVMLSDGVLNQIEYSYTMQSDSSSHWEGSRRNWEVIFCT